jgi:hypothetical protein
MKFLHVLIILNDNCTSIINDDNTKETSKHASNIFTVGIVKIDGTVLVLLSSFPSLILMVLYYHHQ